MQPIARDKGKGPIVPDDVDTPEDDELSSSSSPSLNLSPVRNTRESIRTKSHKRPSPHLAFSNTVSGTSYKTKREASRRQYQPGPTLGNPPVLPSITLPPASLANPSFGSMPTFYVPSETIIRRPNDMLSSPLGQHILDYEPPREFALLTFTTLNVSANPYYHMLHYNQAMTMNAGNDCLLCKLFPASLRGPMLT